MKLGANFVATPMFFNREQTVIFYDWDDTLFPTEEILTQWKIKISSTERPVLTLQQKQDLQAWRSALREVLETACELSARCVILTNAKRPWVEDCIDDLAPELEYLFSKPGGVRVVYAIEHLHKTRPELHCRINVANPTRYGSALSEEEFTEALTLAKYAAMKEQVSQFYSQYEQQTWKNILSFGDSYYEYDALRDVAFRRVPPSTKEERLRAKCILWPTSPSVSELALRFRLHEATIQAYVDFDGDVNLDLKQEADPLQAIGKAINLPGLGSVPWLGHAWGLEESPSRNNVERSLSVVRSIVNRDGFDKFTSLAENSGESETSVGSQQSAPASMYASSSTSFSL
jgi:hypothetical protein